MPKSVMNPRVFWGASLIVGALLYLVVTIPLTRYTAWLERRMARER